MGPTSPKHGWLSAIHELRAMRQGKRAALAYQRGDVVECERRSRKALSIMESTFGDVSATAGYMSSLAGLLAAQARYEEAEPLSRRALAISEKLVGPDHPHVRGQTDNLASILLQQAAGDRSSEASRQRAAEAETLYRRLLDPRPSPTAGAPVGDDTEPSGESEPAIEARIHSDLAQALTLQGKLVEAELSYRKALETYETVSGPADPNLAILLNNLASFYMAEQGNHADAEPLIRRAVEIFEAAGTEWNAELAAAQEKLRSVVETGVRSDD